VRTLLDWFRRGKPGRQRERGDAVERHPAREPRTANTNRGDGCEECRRPGTSKREGSRGDCHRSTPSVVEPVRRLSF
jgi:hypothetical protein